MYLACLCVKILNTNHKELTDLYRKVDRMEGIKKSFIGSGVSYDLLFPEWNKNAGRDEGEYLEELVTKSCFRQTESCSGAYLTTCFVIYAKSSF